MRRVNIILRDTPPTRSAPTDTGVAFLATIPFKGELDTLRPIKSLDQLEQVHGARQSYSVCWDWCETFFREGGHTLYLSPVRGPNPVAAAAAVAGSSTGTAFTITASSVGDWANGSTGGLSYQIVVGPSGGSNRQIVIFLNAVEVDRSAEFSVNTDAPAALANSDYVDPPTLGAGTGLVAAGSATNLTSGTLDRTNITQTQVDAALALLVRDLGPGQVAAPDWQTTAAQTSLLSHAAAMNRYALCDTVDTTTKSTLVSAASAVQGNVNGDYGSLLAPWVKIAGTAGGATRSVPPSAYVAAKCAQTDPVAGPAQAPAGIFGLATSALVLGVNATYSDTDQADLETAGVGLIIAPLVPGVTFDTNRTLVEPLGAENEWLQMSLARYRMSLVARAESRGGPFAHRKITGATIAELDTALTGMMMLDEQNDWLLRLSGEPPGASFVVNTGDPVNTPDTIAAQELNAAIGFRPAPGADMVNIYLTAVAATDTVAA